MEDMSCEFLKNLANNVGLTEPALKLFLTILAGYPFALIHRFFIYGFCRFTVHHLYFALAGIGLGYFNYGLEIAHPIFAVMFTYITLLLFSGTAISVAVVFIFNMGYLLIGYYYTSTDSYDVTWTMPHCILVLRLIGLAFDLYDGRQSVEKLTEERKQTALVNRPTLLEIMGHSFFPASFLIGPQFSMKRYLDFISGKFGTELDQCECDPLPCVKPAIRRFLLGALYCTLFAILKMFVSDDYMMSEEFANEPFFRRLWILGLWGRYTLYKYIGCWLLTEGACILFGLTYNGKDSDGNPLWNGVENVNLFTFENATEFNHYILSFNKNTNSWVARYIFKRLKFLGNKLLSQAATLLFLAVWHGLHSGYYVCFFLEFVVMFMERDMKPIIKSNEHLYNKLTKPPINILVYLVLRLYTFIFMGWCLLPFVLLKFERYWLAFKNVDYVGFILFGLYPIIYRPLLLKFVKRKKRSCEDIKDK